MKKLIVLVLALALAGASAWVVADRLESPDQVAARAKPPEPVPVVAQLNRGFLNGPITMSVLAQYEETLKVTSPAAAQGGVVTAVDRDPGSTLEAGAVLMRISGRPLFVLTGPFALYRDIQPGDIGDDVQAIQASLKAAGHPTGRDASGTYGRGTQAAVRAMYKNAGYQAPETARAIPPPAAADEAATPVPATATVPSGPVVLRTEVLMAARLPAAVEAIAPVGTQITAETELVTLGAGAVALSSTLPQGSQGALTVGATGTFTADDGAGGAAQVTTMQPTEKGDGVVVVLSTTNAVAAGKSYLLSISNPAVEPGDSLLAPISAIVARGGDSYVFARVGDRFSQIHVNVTGAVGGVAAIEPLDPDAPIASGTEVRIG
jgi:hypothetical protein